MIRHAVFPWCRAGDDPGPGVGGWVSLVCAVLAVACASPPAPWLARAHADDPPPAAAPADSEPDDAGGDERRVFLPTDRARERQLDRAKRLIAAGTWTDAVTVLDDILAGDRDVFVNRPAAAARGTTSIASIKSEATRLIAALPKAGREAYDAQFRGQAERALAAAVSANDADAICAVARRWLNTPAGRRAALLAAHQALEAGQPLAAAAWLDRLAADATHADVEPTLSVMRAVAVRQAGDAAAAVAILERARAAARGPVRIGGRDIPLSFPAGQAGRWLDEVVGQVPDAAVVEGEWRQPRGTAARNGLAAASRPLLAARYRVPVARHPGEGRLVEARRQAFADQDVPLFPAATPLAVDGTIMVRTPLGLLAVDFVTGKRIWLQPAAGALDADAAEDQVRSRLPRCFDNLTDGGLSSDGRLVFAIDSHPDAFLPSAAARFEGLQARGRGPHWQGGNTLSAYDIRGRGRLRWRLPEGLPTAGAPGSTAWFMGAPLVVGDRLFVMVEERGEVRLDAVHATDGVVEWSQPLGEVDDMLAIRPGELRGRQLAGLAPALGDGVLVCPLGNGSVVAIDLATRALRWAHEYRRSQREQPPRPEGLRGRLPGRGGFMPQPRSDTPADADRWRDEGPIVVGGRVLLTPHDADELICLDLLDGAVRWTLPRDRRLLTVAGVVGGRVIIVGRRGVEAVDLETGRAAWTCGFNADGAAPSGRGVLTADRLFLPLDVPEVIEIDLVAGTIVGRAPARGGAVPGNLVAYRGEMISVGCDCLDVFHQVEALEPRIETALRGRSDAGWAAHWGGQLDIDRGRIAAGMSRLLEACRTVPGGLPPDEVAVALETASDRDFPAAVSFWRAVSAEAGGGAAARTALCGIVDGLLRAENLPAAWDVCSELLAAQDDPAAGLVVDRSDRRVRLTDRAWVNGRLERLRAGASPALAAEIDARLADAVARADATPDPAVRLRRLDLLAARFGDLPAGLAARQRIAGAAAGAGSMVGQGPIDPVRRDLAILELARSGDPSQRAAAAAAVTAAAGPVGGAAAGLEAWPLGRVKSQRPAVDRKARVEDARSRHLAIPVETSPQSLLPGISLAYDQQASRLTFLDGFGRPLGDPVAVDRPDVAPIVPGAIGTAVEAVAQGRVVFVRSAGTVAAFAVGDGEGSRRLWTTASSVGRAAQPLFAIRPRQPAVGIHRQGELPLGARITEPEDPFAAPTGLIWCGPRTTGVPVYEGRALTVYDPASGAMLWKRHRLPPAGELLADEETICVCTPSGRGSLILSMADGRVLREVDLPDRRRRLLAAGRLLLAIDEGPGADEGQQRERVVLEVWDPLAGTRHRMGEFSGAARARAAGPGRLAVLDPAGTLTLLDVSRQAVVFTTRLGDMPERVDLLQVVPWLDRLLVLAGRRDDAGQGAEPDSILPLQQTLLAGHDGQMVTYSIWAVDGSSGGPLWSVPATVAHHCLHPVQPSALPVLMFCRQIQGTAARDTTRLSVLCLDKRTGHAVFEDDRIRAQPHLLYGCDMVGDPAAHTITLRSRGGDARQVVLDFTGGPLAPRTPHQSPSRPPRSAEGWDAWMERTLRSQRER